MKQATQKTVSVGSVVVGGPKFVVMAGPCSIESQEQLLQTAKHIQLHGASILRGGVWKLRTSASTFQGLGSEALSYAQKVIQQTGLPFVTEITDPRQVEVLAPVVSMFMVGARNMYNYALLKELGMQKKPVLLKRGFSALVDEWQKASEYVLQGGNENVIFCERGIRTFETSTRNTLDLNSVAVLKSRTHLPVIVDPSHAVGLSEFVPQMALASAAAGADGLILEVHPDPSKALSDGRQALSFTSFAETMAKLERLLTALDRPFVAGSSASGSVR